MFQYQHYIFVVSAQDAGVPNLSSTVTVYMNVIDLNDNSPVFDPLSYNAEVSEDAPLNTTVLTVHASDLDSGKCFKAEDYGKRAGKRNSGEYWDEIRALNALAYMA